MQYHLETIPVWEAMECKPECPLCALERKTELEEIDRTLGAGVMEPDVRIHFNDRGHTVPGDGDFPMKRYYDEIVAHDFRGTCSFEICDRRYYCDPDKAIDDIVAWLRENTHELD